jgi:scyllo-inositol 2-dehydrogenase (NADP+)
MRVVVVGLGNQGKKRQVVAGAELVATVDPFNAEATYKDLSQVPIGAYDAALVCTPEGQKLRIADFLLTNGKHVLIEKPLLSEDRTLLTQLRDLAAKNGVACYTAFNHRFEPHIYSLKKAIDAGELGQIYKCRFFYGNGTAIDVRSSVWRDQGMGVLADLGSHLLDLFLFFFENYDVEIVPWGLKNYENRAFDHVLFGACGNPILEFEATLLSWRNSFYIDIWGEKGSAHIDGLCKWGASAYTVRHRILPSGKPHEEKFVIERPDSTWESEFLHFNELCQFGGTNIENDIWINDILLSLVDEFREETPNEH